MNGKNETSVWQRPTANHHGRAGRAATHLPTVVKRARVLNGRSLLTTVERCVALAILDRMGPPFPDGLFVAWMSFRDIEERSGVSLDI